MELLGGTIASLQAAAAAARMPARGSARSGALYESSQYELKVGRQGGFDYLGPVGSARQRTQLGGHLEGIDQVPGSLHAQQLSPLDLYEQDGGGPSEDVVLVFDMDFSEIDGDESRFADQVAAHVSHAIAVEVGGKVRHPMTPLCPLVWPSALHAKVARACSTSVRGSMCCPARRGILQSSAMRGRLCAMQHQS